ncbi:MAG: peptide chain release factor 2 [Planctomycetes bacterium DG_23]|nr:MAG: peptide chain release factor 2 [Planctomycetes bacterium DG_23]
MRADEGAARTAKEMKRLKALNRLLKPIEETQSALEDLTSLHKLVLKEPDAATLEEIKQELRSVKENLKEVELSVLFAGPEDAKDVYLSIHAGAGGTESCDWAQMLLRMYTRYLEREGFSARIVDLTPGEETGIRSVTLSVEGDFTYGKLKSEIGVHRLVRISPFDAAHRRHTSFASVNVIPKIEEDLEVEIKDEDLRIDTFRASSAGGQHLNKTSSAVRITHLPTGVVAQCQNERSQHRNKAEALRILKAKLYGLKLAERQEELDRLYSEKGEIAWGNQIRSYVLHPYTLVKDHRTGFETSDAGAILDGDLDQFIEAFLRQSTSGN